MFGFRWGAARNDMQAVTITPLLMNYNNTLIMVRKRLIE